MTEGISSDPDRALALARQQQEIESARVHHVDSARPAQSRPTSRDASMVTGLHSTYESPATQAFLAGAGRDIAAGSAVDATRDAYAGPYKVDGKQTSSPVMFKLYQPYDSQTNVADLGGLVGAGLAARVQSGQAAPADIVHATKMLIDKGKLPVEPAGDLPGRIKTMQWKYGIGIDCACFTRHAVANVTGRKSLPVGSDLGLRQLDSNPHFAKIKLPDLRSGDLITLDPKPPETIGHNVVVRSHDRLTDLEAKGQAAASPELGGFFAGAGPFHTISVDSSWGAGEDGSLQGGYRRETWLYDESTKQWAHQDPKTHIWKVATNAPTAWDTFHGAYRVKS